MRAGRKLAGTRDPPWLGFANESKIPASIIASLLFYTREYFAPVDKEPPVLSPHSPRTHARVHRVLPVARAHTLPVVISLSLPPYLSLERAATLFRLPRFVLVSSPRAPVRPLCPSFATFGRSPSASTSSSSGRPLLSLSLSLSRSRAIPIAVSAGSWRSRETLACLSLSPPFHQFLVHKPLSDLFLALANPPLSSLIHHAGTKSCAWSHACVAEQTDRDSLRWETRVSRKGGNWAALCGARIRFLERECGRARGRDVELGFD